MPDDRPGPKDLALKVLARIKTRGVREVLGLALGRVKEAIASQNRLVILERACGPDAGEAAGLQVRRATRADGPAYARDIGTDSAATFATRLSPATRCYLALDGAAIVHATWCTTTGAWTRELHAYLVPPHGDAYVYESFTGPSVRGRGVYPAVLRAIAADLEREGLEKVWVAVEADNTGSLKAVTKGGFEEVGSIVFTRRWGRVRIEGRAGDHPKALQVVPGPLTSPSGG